MRGRGDRLVRVAVETGEILEEVPCPHTVVHVLRVLRDGRHVLCLPAGPVTISGGISEVRLAPTES